MAAVIQRVVASPVKTEYLSSGPGEPEVWGEKRNAFVFPTHAIADGVASRMRVATQAARHETGELGACFVHARTLENSEWDEFGAGGRKNLSGGPVVELASADSGGAEVSRATPSPTADGNAPPAQKNGHKKNGEIVVKMDPKRLGEIQRDPVEAYG